MQMRCVCVCGSCVSPKVVNDLMSPQNNRKFNEISIWEREHGKVVHKLATRRCQLAAS